MEKIFIVSPHFPPSSLPPSQRTRLIVKHLDTFNWYPFIFTVSQEKREELSDEWMVTLLGENFTSIEVGCFDPKITRKFGIGDLGLRMILFIIFPLIRNIKKQKPNLIYYPVPPWYILLIAPLVRIITGVKYVIDFIDPWVYKGKPKGVKARFSMAIARYFEGYVTRNSSGIVAVSQGIIDDLYIRHPRLDAIPSLALPYGVEVSDFSNVKLYDDSRQNIMTGRYIGAISESMKPIANAFIQALKNSSLEIQIEFIGTSYASVQLTTPILTDYITEDIANQIKEYPNRKTYREALELTMNSDFLLLLGDTTKYYAASKLMGLIASKKPFLAIVHEESFPSVFLKENQHPYLVTYTDEINFLVLEQEIANVLNNLLASYKKYSPLNTMSSEFQKFSAQGMTEKLTNFLNNIK
jgi:hypothetical protein